MRKLPPARVSYRGDFFISYCLYIMMGLFISRSFKGAPHVDKFITRAIQNRKHYACTRPVPVHLQTDFAPKQVVVLHLHETGVKFSLQYNNRGELMPG